MQYSAVLLAGRASRALLASPQRAMDSLKCLCKARTHSGPPGSPAPAPHAGRGVWVAFRRGDSSRQAPRCKPRAPSAHRALWHDWVYSSWTAPWLTTAAAAALALAPLRALCGTLTPARRLHTRADSSRAHAPPLSRRRPSGNGAWPTAAEVAGCISVSISVPRPSKCLPGFFLCVLGSNMSDRALHSFLLTSQLAAAGMPCTGMSDAAA